MKELKKGGKKEVKRKKENDGWKEDERKRK